MAELGALNERPLCLQRLITLSKVVPIRKPDIARLRQWLAEATLIDSAFDKLGKEVNSDKLDQLHAARNKEHKKKCFSFALDAPASYLWVYGETGAGAV